MRQTIRWGAFAAAMLLAGGARAETRLCAGFLPENSLRIPVSPIHADGVAQDRFNKVLDRVEKVYKPIFKKKGFTLVVERKWEDETVNAYAMRDGKKAIISMFGGLARHAAVTEEGFALVACHEVGHHLGGYPKPGWHTNEGGSDYFATLKCLRKVLPVKLSAATDPLVRASCFEARGRRGGTDCERSAMAGLSTAKLLAELGGEGELSFANPDPTVVDDMMNWHPPAQCRLDTYFQGALCDKGHGSELSNTDPSKGACTSKGKSRVGLRPRCWYKPPENEPAPKVMVERLTGSADPAKVAASAATLADELLQLQ